MSDTQVNKPYFSPQQLALLDRISVLESTVTALEAELERANHNHAAAEAELKAVAEGYAAELAEQCRLNGMGSEREARLMARVEELERDRQGIDGVILQLKIDLGEANEQFAAAQAKVEELSGMREEVLHYQREFHRLRDELANEKAKHIHSCDDDCAQSGCVNRRLREELAKAKLNETAAEEAAAGLEEKLAAAQAREAKLLEALGVLSVNDYCGYECSKHDAGKISEALALPADRSALDAMLAEARRQKPSPRTSFMRAAPTSLAAMFDDLVEELLQPWSADFALQPKTASERFDVIYIQELRRQAAEQIQRLQFQLDRTEEALLAFASDARCGWGAARAADKEIERLLIEIVKRDKEDAEYKAYYATSR